MARGNPPKSTNWSTQNGTREYIHQKARTGACKMARRSTPKSTNWSTQNGMKRSTPKSTNWSHHKARTGAHKMARRSTPKSTTWRKTKWHEGAHEKARNGAQKMARGNPPKSTNWSTQNGTKEYTTKKHELEHTKWHEKEHPKSTNWSKQNGTKGHMKKHELEHAKWHEGVHQKARTGARKMARGSTPKSAKKHELEHAKWHEATHQKARTEAGKMARGSTPKSTNWSTEKCMTVAEKQDALLKVERYRLSFNLELGQGHCLCYWLFVLLILLFKTSTEKKRSTKKNQFFDLDSGAGVPKEAPTHQLAKCQRSKASVTARKMARGNPPKSTT